MSYSKEELEILENRRRDDPKDDAIAKKHPDYAVWRRFKDELLQHMRMAEFDSKFTDEEIIKYYKVAEYIESEQGLWPDEDGEPDVYEIKGDGSLKKSTHRRFENITV